MVQFSSPRRGASKVPAQNAQVHARSARTRLRRRDTHGRGIRGPLLPSTIPAWQTRSQAFDELLSSEIASFQRKIGNRLERFDFAVMDVPQSDPAPWEDRIPLGRFLPFERPARIHGRILFYRMPIIEAARREPFPELFIHGVVASQLASALGIDPDDLLNTL